MKFFAKLFLSATAVAMLLWSCEKDDSNNEQLPSLANGTGAFITCEGKFDSNDGSISYFNLDTLIENDVFGRANAVDGVNATTGDVVTSFAIVGSKAVFVANHSGKTKVVELTNFKQTGEVKTSYPRYFLAIDGTSGYLTNGNFDGKVYKINVNSATITDSISVGSGPEHLQSFSGKVYVANSGGWGRDSTISVIDPLTNTVVKSINVHADCPTDMVFVNQKIWVVCNGYTDYVDFSKSTPARLVVLDATTNEVYCSLELPATDFFSPYRIAAGSDGKTVYYSNNTGVYAINTSSFNKQLPASAFITIAKMYGLGVNPQNGDVYCLISTGYTTNGIMNIYSSEGVKKSESNVGISPNGVCFNF